MGTINVSPDMTHTLVSGRFEMAQAYADQTFGTALGYLGEFDQIDVSLNWSPSYQNESELPSGILGLSPTVPVAPGLNEINIAPAEFVNEAPVLEDHDVVAQDVPDFNVALPNFISIDVPTTQVPAFTTAQPAEQDVQLPSPDDIPNLPPLPTIKEILPPDEPSFEMPDFAATMPVADLTPPDLTYSWNEAEYDSTVMTSLKAKLVDGIMNGGTGIVPEAEQAIYDRAASRLDIELQSAETKAFTDFASRGSRLPGGALVARLQEAQLQSTLARTDLTRDVLIKSADLAYQYSTFVIEKGISLEHELMALFNSVQQRSFEASKAVLEFAVQTYDVSVRAYSARLEGYKTEAEVFKARISAEIAKAELYSSIVTGRKLSMEMQGLMVELYSKQCDSIKTMAQIYATKMDGAKVESEIYGTKIEQYKGLIEAYKAQVEGVTAEYNLYQAQLVGESEKAKVYAYQVDAYKSVVDAYKSRSDIDISVLQAKIEKNKGEISVFNAQLEKYKTDISANVSQAEIQAKNEGLKMQAFDGEVRKFSAVVSALVESYRASSAVDIANADADMRHGEMLAKLETAEAEIQAEIVKAKALVASQLASSSLASVSAGASLGYQESRGESTSDRYTQSTSYTNSDSNINRNCCNS